MARPPIAVLLLPRRLEDLEDAEEVAALLRAGCVVALEPGFLGFGREGRAARSQARRMLRRLPGRPVAVVVFGEREQPLARELSERVMGCELIAARGAEGLRERLAGCGLDV